LFSKTWHLPAQICTSVRGLVFFCKGISTFKFSQIIGQVYAA
jgi:hypothetical protein